MPIHYRAVQEQISQAGIRAGERQEVIQKHRARALQLLQQLSENIESLSTLAESASQINPNLRCAVPLGEKLTATFSPTPSIPPHILLAADGSQINPSRHDPIAFGLVNVGVMRIDTSQAAAPKQFVQSTLIIPDPLDPEEWDLNEQIVALLRDLSERKILAEISKNEDKPVVALTDGPLEVFRQLQQEKFYDQRFSEYLVSLLDMANQNGIAAGYVVKPTSDLTVRLLELTLLSSAEIKTAAKPRHLAGVIDSDLFSQILAPGQRSAVFRLQSASSRRYQTFDEKLSLCFFYLNTGSEKQPSLARVEVPLWVAEKKEMMDLLHAVLVDQCRIMGNKPYPYILHRSHEIALVRQEEKDQVLAMLIREMTRQKVEIRGSSTKQAIKDTTHT